MVEFDLSTYSIIILCSLIFGLQISTGKNDKGLKLYDPGYLNTAPVRSTISYIDGDEGILRYRGYPIEELAEKSTFPEVAYLICEYFSEIFVLVYETLCRVVYRGFN
jgi:hypothetical protein